MKKKKQFWKTCYTTNFSIFAKEKKTSPFSLKDLCKIYFVQKTKRTFLKTSCCRLVYKKEKEKQSLYLQSFNFNDKTLLVLFKAKFAYGQKKNREHLSLEKKQRFFVKCFQAQLFFSSNFPK